jgi:hypothetical protein
MVDYTNTNDVVADEKQTISITDIIAEGPIYGLVNGPSSVYLNKEPQFETGYVPRSLSKGASRIAIKNGSKDAHVVLTGTDLTTQEDLDILKANRTIVVRDNHAQTGVNIEPRLVFGSYDSSTNTFSWIEDAYAVSIGSDNSWYNGKDYITNPNSLVSERFTNYTPVRIRNTTQGVDIEGRLNTINSDYGSQYLTFVPGTYESDVYPAIMASPGLINDDDTYELYVDRIVHLDKDGKSDRGRDLHVIGPVITPNADGSKSFKIVLDQEWNHNLEETISAVDLGAETVTVSNHSFNTGEEIHTNRLGISGYTNSSYQPLYAIKVDANTLAFATTYQNALDGVKAGIFSTGGSGTKFVEKAGYEFDDFGYDTSNAGNAELAAIIGKKAVGTQVQFRTGTQHQTPLLGLGGYGSTAVSTSSNQALAQTNEKDFGGTQSPVTLLATSANGFNLSGAQVATVDTIKVRTNFPGGLTRMIGAHRQRTYVKFIQELFIKGIDDTDFVLVESRTITNNGNSQNSVTAEEVFDLNMHRPFEDFKVVVHRAFPDDGDGILNAEGRTQANSINISKSTIAGTTSLFKEKLNHPFTSLGNVTFTSGEFDGTPDRGYHCKGLLIKVPSNYVTRDEALDGVASYTRDSNGVITNTYQDWDGTFRTEKVYTNNPAWIFYDIITNNRYGLGDFIAETDIDKYSLYRIARYCDELVDDGKGLGTTEPRYTMNIYLTKSIDAYKVLKDMASNFVTMLYYLNGQLFPSQDSPAGPVYAFSKANVLEGAFTYESSGSKTRANQVIVNWNNPESNYELEPLIVEDVRNISETGTLITQEVTAFGCTSQGQATRYGKWKLWTATNQQEVVSFSTGINGSFITPGDIVLVQDADRNTTRLSGRINADLLSGLTETATYSGAIGGSPSGFTSTQRAQPAVFSGIAVLPSSFSNSAEVLFEHGGTGQGTLVGMVDVSGTKKLIVRSGHGAVTTESDADQVVKFINISDIPEFDDQSHRVTLELHPTATGGGSVRFWIDNRLVVDETTTGSSFNSNLWSGGDEGGWGERGDNIAGYNSGTTPTNTNFQNWSGTLVTNLSVYSNQTVSVFPTRNKIPVDSAITIDTNNTYELSIIFQGDAAFLAEDSADISFTDSTCDITGSSTTIDCDSTAFMKVGQSVTHASRIPAGTTITAINSATQFTISQATTAGSGLVDTECTFTTSYVKGDRVTEAYIDDNGNGTYTFQAIDSSTDAANAKASAAATDALVLTWKDDFRVETQEVDKTATGTGSQTSLSMKALFSSVPSAGEVWVVTEKNADLLTLEGSGKEYRVLSIAQNSKNEYEISAVEHYDEKFDSIEKDLNTYIPSLVARTVTADTVVPVPNDVWLNLVTVRGRTQENLEVRWDAQVQRSENLTNESGEEVSTLVDSLDNESVRVEISHNITEFPTPILVPASNGLYTFENIQEGNHIIAVRIVNMLNNRSIPVVREVEITGRLKDRTKNVLPDAFHAGGTISRGMEIS